MTEAVHDYDGLRETIRGHIEALNIISLEAIDEQLGFTRGHTQKLLSGSKHFGRHTLGPLLGFIGLSFEPHAAPDAATRITQILGVRKCRSEMLRAATHNQISFRLTRRHMKKLGKLGNKARTRKLKPSTRRRIARQAANARWHKPRVVEVKGAAAKRLRALVEPSATAPTSAARSRRPQAAGSGARTRQAPRRSRANKA